MQTEDAVARLHSQLPLKSRQQQLDPELVGVHRAILRSLVELGRPPVLEETAKMLPGRDAAAMLARLGSDDLVVLDAQGAQVVGAYPVTVEQTPHRISVNGHQIHAMCALDALSVGPMFDAEVVIDSQCHVTNEAIRIHQEGVTILEASPSTDIRVGIRWSNPTECAAHSMCMEMVFLCDVGIGEEWQGSDTENITLFTLPEAVAFGAAFFVPLLHD